MEGSSIVGRNCSKTKDCWCHTRSGTTAGRCRSNVLPRHVAQAVPGRTLREMWTQPTCNQPVYGATTSPPASLLTHTRSAIWTTRRWARHWRLFLTCAICVSPLRMSWPCRRCSRTALWPAVVLRPIISITLQHNASLGTPWPRCHLHTAVFSPDIGDCTPGCITGHSTRWSPYLSFSQTHQRRHFPSSTCSRRSEGSSLHWSLIFIRWTRTTCISVTVIVMTFG